MQMEFKVRQDEYNSLLKRKEVLIEVDHEESGTPSRIELKKAVAAKYGTKPENVYVVDVETKTGTQNAICELQVYDDPKIAASIVPKYIQVRDLPSEERKKAREQKAKKEEKPKEEKAKVEKAKEAKPKQEEKTKQEEKAQPEPPKKSKEGAAK
jgi:ribosomal protein S24E